MNIALRQRDVSPSFGFHDERADEMVERARQIAVKIRADARQADRDRRMSDENYALIEDAGLLDLICPIRDGGYGMSLTTFARCIHEIAKASGAAGWLYALQGSTSWSASKFPPKLHAEYFAGTRPSRTAASVALNGTIEKVEGGYLLNGKWPYCTGAWHSQWGGGGVFLIKPDGTREPAGLVLARMETLTRVDNWYPTGMRGTGSIAVQAENVLIPEHYLLPNGKEMGTADEVGSDPCDYWDYRNALVMQNAQASVGAAEGILDRAREILSGKRCFPFTIYEPENAVRRMGSSEIVQHQFARSAALIYSAREILMRGMTELDETALDRRPMTEERSAYLRTEQSLISEMVREATDKLFTVLGNGALSEAETMEIAWRDIGVITRHANVATNIGYQAYGKAALNG